MSESDYLYINNDNDVTLRTAEVNGTAITTGTGTWSLLDSEGDAVSGATGSLTYVGGSAPFSAGDWQGTIPSSVTLTEGERYTVVTVISSSGNDGEWRLSRVAKYRGNS